MFDVMHLEGWRHHAICSVSLLSVLMTNPIVAGQQTAMKFPDTRAGRCAKAFVESFNAASDDARREFEQTWRSESALKARPIEGRLALANRLRDDWGALTPVKVDSTGERALTLIVRTADDELFKCGFEFESQAPFKLNGVRIEGPLRESELAAAEMPLDAQTRDKAIRELAEALRTTYVYPEMGEKLADALEKRLENGDYAKVDSADELAGRLMTDLQAICKDRHLQIRAVSGDRDTQLRPTRRPAEQVNYGFEKLEILPGGIGYLKLNEFADSDEAMATADAAMAFLAHCRALIFDLRNNGGGSPRMIKQISSYLFDKPTHLNSFYDRTSNKTSETWTTAEVAGHRFAADVPVYILTSAYTFSAAEEFSYNLKHLGRATIVGEKTGGGAHPVTARRIGGRFEVLVPYARAFNPITMKNWEGVGVIPQIETSADKALEAAQADARKRLVARGRG